MPEIKPANHCEQQGGGSNLKTSCTCHMCPVSADLSMKILLDTCGRARHTCAPAAHYYICQQIISIARFTWRYWQNILCLFCLSKASYLLLLFLFFPFSLLDCRQDGQTGLQLSYLVAWSSCNVALTHGWKTPLLTEGHQDGTFAAWKGFCFPVQWKHPFLSKSE